MQIGNSGIVYPLATRLLQTSQTSARCQYSIISMAYVICSAIYRRRAVCTIQNTTIHRRLRLHAEINLLTVAMATCELQRAPRHGRDVTHRRTDRKFMDLPIPSPKHIIPNHPFYFFTFGKKVVDGKNFRLRCAWENSKIN